MFNELFLLAIWLLSLMAATFVGHDRGRWWEGLLLGLGLGPVGVIAAGLLQPSLALVAERQWLLAQAMDARRREEREALRRKRVERAQMQEWAADVEQVILREEATFADGLEELSMELKSLESQPAPEAAQRIGAWSRWLKDKAVSVRTTPRDQLENPPPPGAAI